MTAFDYGHRIKPETMTSEITPGTAVAAFSHRGPTGPSASYTAFIIADGKNLKVKAVTDEGPWKYTVVRMVVDSGDNMESVLSSVVEKLDEV